LLSRIREIRASERRFNQKITDLYATSADYNIDADETKDFFATVQNMLLFAITGQTAAEIIKSRSDKNKLNMGLTTWEDAPHGKILQADAVISKNYLNEMEFGFIEEKHPMQTILHKEKPQKIYLRYNHFQFLA